MNSSLLIFIICQGVATILDEAKKTRSNILETNSNKMSPKEKLRCEQKIRFFSFFKIVLIVGGTVNVLLSMALEILNTLK